MELINLGVVVIVPSQAPKKLRTSSNDFEVGECKE